MIADRLKSEGEETLRMILEDGGDAIFLNLDLLASDDATHMTGATLQTDGGWTSF